MSRKDKKQKSQSSNIDSLLAERGAQYGRFDARALCAQRLKTAFYDTCGRTKLSASQAEAVDMILHKLARIANGNPNHVDSWDDIAGYAMLESKILKGVPL